MRTVMVALVALVLSATSAVAVDLTETGFYYPTGSHTLGSYAGWLAVPPAYFDGYYHIGKDIDTGEVAPVYAISNGIVIYISSGGWGTNNKGVFVRHTLVDGSQFVALYGHVRTSKVVNDAVQAGVQFATIGPWDPTHLHFGIHPGGTIPSDPYGMLPLPVTSPYNGWQDPIDWIATHSPAGAYSCSFVSKSISPAGPYVPGQTVTCQVKFKNEGTATWSKTGGQSNYVELGSCDGNGGIGYSFFNYPCTLPNDGQVPSWLNCKVPCTFVESNVPHGSNATFNFTGKIRDTLPSTYSVYFGPVWNSAIMSGWVGTHYAVQVTIPESFSTMTLTPIAGDWNGDGVSEVGVYADETQTFYLDTNNDGYTELELHYSSAVDKPLAGNWAGGGYYGVGFYRPAYRTFWLDYDNNGQMDNGIVFGDGGDTPLAGDWLGNGYSRIGLYRPSTRTFWLDYDNNGTADFSRVFGDATDIPITGDWDCDLDWNIGVYRPSTRTFWLDYNNDGSADFSRTFGDAGDLPVVGDWTGNCGTNIGVFRPSTQEFWLDYNNDGTADRGFQIQRIIPGSPKITAHGEDNTLPRTFSLSQNYPNPFNPGTTIRYTLPRSTHVVLSIYNVLGQKLETLIDEHQFAGEYIAFWDGSRFASGMYFYRLVTDQAVETKKMILLK